MITSSFCTRRHAQRAFQRSRERRNSVKMSNTMWLDFRLQFLEIAFFVPDAPGFDLKIQNLPSIKNSASMSLIFFQVQV